MKRAMAWVMALACALVLVAPKAQAQRPPETHPSSEHRDIVMSWDRSALPGDVELWAPKTVLAYSSVPPYRYAKSHLVCRSNADTGQGKCPTIGLANQDDAGAILVRLTEQRSGQRTEIKAFGSGRRPATGPTCYSDYWSTAVRPLWAIDEEKCGRDQAAGLGVQLALPTQELLKLVAGKWIAELVLDLREAPAGPALATYVFSLDFTVSDSSAVAIYLPEFDHATPSVDLNLRYNPFAHTVEGRKVLDMCLYDGLGSHSTYLGVTVRDTGGRTPGPTGFSVWHDSGGSDERRRLDYTLALDHNGTSIALANGVEQQLTGIDSARLRLVMLPGMTLPVFCVPTPLTLTTPRFPSTSKEAGHYIGDLQVELRVPTATP